MIDDRDIPLLARKLIPHLAKRNWSTGAASQANSSAGGVSQHALYGAAHTGTLDRSQAPWVSSDIAAAIATHNTTGDPHNQYMHISVARTVTAIHALNNGVTSTNADSEWWQGRALVGYVGHVDFAGFSHRDMGTQQNYLVGQDSTGDSHLNTKTGRTIKHRVNNADVMSMTASNLTLFSPLAVTTDNYASQVTGWKITYAGAADFRYLFVDEMHAKSFIADLEQALAGGQIICKSVAVLYSNFTAPVAGGITTITVRDLPSAIGMAAFVNGDIIRIRQFSRSGGSLSISDCWGVVTLDTSYGTSGFDSATKTQRYTFTRSLGGNAGAMASSTVVQADAIILDYGTTGNGFYEVNAIDGAYGANSPYSQIVTWTTHPHTGQSVMVRLGNLTGLGFTGEYGLYARGTSSSQYLLATGTSGILLRNTVFRQYNGSDLFMQADTSGLVYYVPSSSSAVDRTSILFKTTGGTKIFELSGFSNISDGREAFVRIHPGTTDSTLYLMSKAPTGYYSNVVIQNTVNTTTKQWIFKQLSSGVTGADFVGYLGLNPDGTGVNGLEVNMPTSTTAYAMVAKYNGTERLRISIGASADFLQMSSYDAGSGAGPNISVGRNSNGSTAAPGTLSVITASNSSAGLWPDNSGVWRTAQDTGITSANFASAGSVVGSQTSWHELKQDITPHVVTEDLLQAVLAVPLYDFRMVGDTVGDDYTGIVITEQDKQSRAWYACNLGGVPALNERNLFGYLIGAIQAQQAMIEELQREQWQH